MKEISKMEIKMVKEEFTLQKLITTMKETLVKERLKERENSNGLMEITTKEIF